MVKEQIWSYKLVGHVDWLACELPSLFWSCFLSGEPCAWGALEVIRGFSRWACIHDMGLV